MSYVELNKEKKIENLDYKDSIYYSSKEELEPLKNREGDLERGFYAVLYKDVFRKKAIKIYDRIGDLQTRAKGAFFFMNNAFLRENNVVVPEKKVYIAGKLEGYATEIVDGYNMWELGFYASTTTICFTDLLEAYHNAFGSIQNISSIGIKMKDCNEKNIMYDIKNNTFKFIDIDGWKYQEEDYEKLLEENITNFKNKVQIKNLETRMQK